MSPCTVAGLLALNPVGGAFDFARLDQAPPLLLGLLALALVLWWPRRGPGGADWPIGAARALGRRARLTSRVLWSLAALALAGALLEPRGAVEPQLEPVPREIHLLLDVSRSMLARDGAQSRLERAQTELCLLSEALPGDRLALWLFAGELRLVVPPTRDGEALRRAIRQADPTAVTAAGSDPEGALGQLLLALAEDPSPAPRALVLASDGESTLARENSLGGEPSALDSPWPLFCLALGSERGARIPLRDAAGRERYLLDAAGRPVETRAAPEGLARWARESGGAFLSDELPLGTLAGLVPVALPLGFAPSAERSRPRPLWPWPTGLACGLCVAALLVRSGATRRRFRPWWRGQPARPLLAAGLIGCLWPSPLVRQEPEAGQAASPRDAEAWFEAARADYAAGHFQAALSAFESARSAWGAAPRLEHAFALALAAARAGELGRAEDCLQEARGFESAGWRAPLEYLAADLSALRAERAAELARQPEAEPFAWNAALGALDGAIASWRAALDEAAQRGQDLPALRRNWERALLLSQAWQAERDANQKPPEQAQEQPPEGERELLEQAPEESQSPPEELAPEALIELLRRLEARDATKRALRAAAAERRRAAGERDW